MAKKVKKSKRKARKKVSRKKAKVLKVEKTPPPVRTDIYPCIWCRKKYKKDNFWHKADEEMIEYINNNWDRMETLTCPKCKSSVFGMTDYYVKEDVEDKLDKALGLDNKS